MNPPEEKQSGAPGTENEQAAAAESPAGQPALAPSGTTPSSGDGLRPQASGQAPQQSSVTQAPNSTTPEGQLPPLAEPVLRTDGQQEPEEEQDSRPHPERAGVMSLVSTIITVLFVITFIVQAFQIPSQSMEKTLLIGDYLLVDKVHFGEPGWASWLVPYRDIQRGDIVVFHYPVDTSQHFVKRVIGVPGDRIRLRNKTVFVNDAPLNESYVIHTTLAYSRFRDSFPSDRDYTGQVDPKWQSEIYHYLQDGELVVPKDQYFVMGDNRDESLDSRFWGFVPRENVVGRPLVIYLSLREEPERVADSGNRFFRAGNLLVHGWQFARWNRIFKLVR